jgi:hypothetical protein
VKAFHDRSYLNYRGSPSRRQSLKSATVRSDYRDLFGGLCPKKLASARGTKEKKNISGGEDRIKIIDRKNVRRLRHTWSPSVDISRLVVFFFFLCFFFPISFLFFVTHKVPPPPATKLIKSSWVAGNAFSLRNENSFESKESLSLRLLFQRFAYYVFILLARYFNK